MVIIFSRQGQLANRLLSASHLLASAIENNYRVSHLYFDEYYEFFSDQLHLVSDKFRVVGRRNSWKTRFWQLLGGLLHNFMLRRGLRRLPFVELIHYERYGPNDPSYNLSDPNFIRKARSKIVLISGWRFDDELSLIKHSKEIKRIWTPNRPYMEVVENKIADYRKNFDKVIGVHIRRGDYEHFNNGVWYYSLEQYNEWIKNLAGLEARNRNNVLFLICTNENNVSLADGENYKVQCEKRHFIEDIYLLSKCDYIIGPPSTFTMWASFHGNVPLLQIKDAKQIIDVTQFHVCIP